MLKYNFHLKSGAAKARMRMAASVAVSTMTLGFTSHAADIQDSIIPAAAILSVEQILGDGLEEAADIKPAEVNEKPAETVEATLEKAEEKAEELRAQKEAEEKRRAEEAAQQALEAALDEDATANRRLEQEVEGTVIRAGALEKSNISIVTEMVNMIAIQRQYESNQKVITTFDESLDIAVNQLGRL